MTIDWGALFGLMGSVSIAVGLVVLGLLSKRLGSVMRTPRYYVWFYVAAVLMAISIVARMLNIGHGAEAASHLTQDGLMVALYVGLPAIANTIGVITAWRYWSWLLAERG